MAEARDRRIPLTVLGGYLGAGKTTWLRHQLHAGAMGRVRVIVNEAAEAPVDDALLGRAAGLTVLAGGPVSGSARAALVAALRDIANDHSAGDHRASDAAPDAVVLETSGLADPAPVVAAIMGDPVLVHHFRLEATLLLVDARHGLTQLAEDPLARRQVLGADRLIVTKTDLAAPAELACLVATLRLLNPGADIRAAVMGETCALPALPDAAPAPLPALPDDEAPPQATHLAIGPDTDWTALTVWLSALLHARGDRIVRVKGVIAAPAGRLLLQGVRREVQRPEIMPASGQPDARDNLLVLIGRGYAPGDLARSLAGFTRMKQPPTAPAITTK